MPPVSVIKPTQFPGAGAFAVIAFVSTKFSNHSVYVPCLVAVHNDSCSWWTSILKIVRFHFPFCAQLVCGSSQLQGLCWRTIHARGPILPSSFFFPFSHQLVHNRFLTIHKRPFLLVTCFSTGGPTFLFLLNRCRIPPPFGWPPL